MPPIPHPLDKPKKIIKQTIHLLCSPQMFHNSKTTCLVYPLALRTNKVNLQPSIILSLFHNSKTTRLVYPLALRTNNVHLQPSIFLSLFHNSKITHSVYPSALPLQSKVGFIPVNLSTRNRTRRNLQTYLQL